MRGSGPRGKAMRRAGPWRVGVALGRVSSAFHETSVKHPNRPMKRWQAGMFAQRGRLERPSSPDSRGDKGISRGGPFSAPCRTVWLVSELPSGGVSIGGVEYPARLKAGFAEKGDEIVVLNSDAFGLIVLKPDDNDK